VGLALSVAMLVLALTGSALVYKEAYWRLVYPELRVAAPTPTPEEQAAAIEAAADAFGERLRSVKFPEPGVAGYHLYLEGGEAFLSIGDHRVIDEWGSRDRLMSFLFDLHAHLLAGEAGERVGGVISLLGVFLAVTGLVLWWPARRQFRVRHLLPSGVRRRDLIAWHRNLGLVSTPILLVVLLSGSGLVFYATAGKLLNRLFGDPPHTASAPRNEPRPPVQPADAGILLRVKEEFPEARLVFYYPPGAAAGHHEFRLKQPCELHPNGRSYLYLDGAGRVLAKEDGCAIAPGQVALHATYPLHSGKVDSALYRLAVFLSGLVLAALSASGAIAYARKLGWLGRS